MKTMRFDDLCFDMISFALLDVLLATNVLRIVVMLALHFDGNA